MSHYLLPCDEDRLINDDPSYCLGTSGNRERSFVCHVWFHVRNKISYWKWFYSNVLSYVTRIGVNKGKVKVGQVWLKHGFVKNENNRNTKQESNDDIVKVMTWDSKVEHTCRRETKRLKVKFSREKWQTRSRGWTDTETNNCNTFVFQALVRDDTSKFLSRNKDWRQVYENRRIPSYVLVFHWTKIEVSLGNCYQIIHLEFGKRCRRQGISNVISAKWGESDTLCDFSLFLSKEFLFNTKRSFFLH
jgi:hypothetical protein